MNQLMSLLLPSIIYVKQLEKIYGESRRKKVYIERYLKSVLLINLITYLITIYIFKKPNFIFTNQFTAKYILLASCIAYMLPIVVKFLKDNINIKIKVEKNEEKN